MVICHSGVTLGAFRDVLEYVRSLDAKTQKSKAVARFQKVFGANLGHFEGQLGYLKRLGMATGTVVFRALRGDFGSISECFRACTELVAKAPKSRTVARF